MRRYEAGLLSILTVSMLTGFRACAPDVPLGNDDAGAPRAGDPCMPIDRDPFVFHANEVYAEGVDPGTRADCGDLACVVYRLEGDLHNLRSAGCPRGEASCVDDVTESAGPLPADSIDRAFCSCRCAADPLFPDAPLCACSGGLTCSSDGWCAPPAALEVDVESGQLCTPEAIPTGGFESSEVYVETDHPACGRADCVVFHLDGDPRNRASDGCPMGAESCVDDTTFAGPMAPSDLRRAACGCRCVADPLDPDAPLCPCVNGLVCAEDAGFCVHPEANDGSWL